MRERLSMNGIIAAIVAFAVVASFLTGGIVQGGLDAASGSRDMAHTGCSSILRGAGSGNAALGEAVVAPAFTLADVPPYRGEPSVAVNGNAPFFTEAERSVAPGYESYSRLDRLGRCGPALALVGDETMPSVTRGSIGSVRPSGWQIARYSWVDGEYLFNRCHLLGFMLTGENANERNLITGTRSLNVVGMLPYEEQVATYVRATGNHVLYRVTPLFEERNLVASGVLMEAESLEDAGVGLSFCAWCYNVEPGVQIDYATGKSHADATMPGASQQPAADGAASGEGEGASGVAGVAGGEPSRAPAVEVDPEATYVVNSSSLKFHRPDCPSVQDMSASHRQMFYGTREEAIDQGYDPCGWCRP